ncbi:glycoside hydrolase superfamily [Gongronella butleri]|nr:glycoside hydrolase superfamily [Gongronella butleri]
MQDEGFVTVRDGQLFRHGARYTVHGANYWHGLNLGSTQGGNRARLDEELDQLAALGVNHLRIMAASEGPDEESQRMRPSLMSSPGEYNETIFQGLDYLLDAMEKREMTATMVLGNFWHWSGGFCQFVSWVTQTVPPYPTRDEASWPAFVDYTRQFYLDNCVAPKANALFKDHIRVVQARLNRFNNKLYREDPVIMSWQIANEPQEAPASWYAGLAKFIKAGAPRQLVSSGIEAKIDWDDFVNATQDMDYATCHLWVENWGKYDPTDINGLDAALTYAMDYLATRQAWATRLCKPLILEEFGLARDAWKHRDNAAAKYDPATTTEHRDQYYDQVMAQASATHGSFHGFLFWAFGGAGRPNANPNEFGMRWTGDPPHEPSGWYSVYDKDASTLAILSKYCHRPE